MEAVSITHSNFNGGEQKIMQFPTSKKDVENQVVEILDWEVYKPPKRVGSKVLIDIGGNIGMSSIYFKDKFKDIYTFEPNPTIFECLKENTKEYDNIHIFNEAIFTYDGDLDMFGVDGEEPQSYHYYHSKKQTMRIVTKCRSLKTVLKEEKIDAVDLLKVDAEGAEYPIFLDDSFEEISDKIRYIVGESHSLGSGGEPNMIPYILKKTGFKTKYIKNEVNNYVKKFTYFNVSTEVEKSIDIPMWTNFRAYK